MTQNANKIMWVEYWIQQIDTNYRNFDISAYKEGDRWISEIDIPLTDTYVRTTANTEVDAILGVAEQAAEVIDKFMNIHPEIDIKNIYKDIPYEIESDEDGRFISIHINKEFRMKMTEESDKRLKETTDIVKEAMEKLKKVHGNKDNLFLQIINKSLLENNQNYSKYLLDAYESLIDTDKLKVSISTLTVIGESVIVFGYTDPVQSEKGEN